VAVSGIASTNPDFAGSGCPALLANGASCAITLTFTPSLFASETGTVNISLNGGSTMLGVSVSGTGVKPLSLSATVLTYGWIGVGTAGKSYSTTLMNYTSSSVIVGSITSTNPDFVTTNNCPASLASDSTCNITVNFTPSQYTSETGVLNVSLNGGATVLSASLQGLGIHLIALDYTSFAFGNVVVGKTSATATTALYNYSGATVTVAPISAPTADWTITTTCGTTLANNSSCNVSVTFAPESKGTKNVAIPILVNGTTTPYSTLSVTGAGQ
jgi:hypothetical protein